MIFNLAGRLHDKGVLGINRRNTDYLLEYNSRRLYPLVDDKLHTKRLAEAAGLEIPELYGVVEIERHCCELSALLHNHEDFVIKPARGSKGNGIIVIAGRSKEMYRKASGVLMDEADMAYHVSNILSGMYSLGGQPDRAIIEYRVKFDPVFERVTYLGVPDVRIIVFLGVPVMSMARLPTRLSDGRANLHQGAIGVGIDIISGQTLTAVWRNDIISDHPDTGNTVTGIQVPGWDRLLKLAARCYELTGLGFVGVDIVFDRDKGPLILELNARPGLNIQLANRTGLLPRLDKVESSHSGLTSVEQRIAFAKQHFGVV